ncbi:MULTISPECIES: outer membrane protein [unclassified Novosphingobium]|uniref:outer membrane protein n=1 Tax=unclassified Novosphingobium TaxID=2644732 RepID=UPI001359AD32|nr:MULTISPECIES: outer membrane beta-barrel protein [unclassified Novosphingobium]
MKKFVTAAAAAALFAVPAAANAQAFVQAETGLDVVSADGDSKANIGYGGSVGYDMQLSGGMFVGVQATYSDSETKSCARADGDKLCLEAGRDVAALVRVGTAVGPQGKLYLMGGYANARAELSFSGNSLDAVGDAYGLDIGNVKANSDLDGFRLGAGYEHALNEKFFVKAEYRYSNYEMGVSRHNGVIALGAKF